MCWLDDEFLVTGARDSKMGLWRVTSDMLDSKQEIPTYRHMSPVSIKDCKHAQKVCMSFLKKLLE